jgi:oligosaccharide repeat unit polymerase
MQAAIDNVEGIRSRYGLLIILIQSIILAGFFLSAILYPSFNNHPERFIYPVCVVLLILFIWTLWSWRALTGNLFDPYILFMAAAFAFNAGLAFLEVFHLNKAGIFNGRFSQQTILETLLLVTIGLTAFHSGALVAVFTRGRKKESSRAARKQTQDGRSLRIVGWALIGVAAIPTVLIIKQSFTVVTSSGYFGLFQQQASTGFGAWPQILSAFLVPGSYFLLAGSKGKRSGIIASFGIVLIYCTLTFLLGGRGGAIMALLAYLWLWHRTVHKVPKTALAVIAIVLIVVLIPLWSVFRNVTGRERYSITAATDAYKSVKSPAVAGLSEIGGSMQTVSYTIDLVPKTRGYDMGASYYYASLTVLPNLFWSVHPAIARGQASAWLVQTVDPYTAEQGGGLGYSFIAEAYLNFGWWGAFIVLGLIGFLFGSLVLWADLSDDIARLAVVASFLSFFLFFARGEASEVVRALVWYSVLPYLAVRFLGYARSREREAISEVSMGSFRTEG